MQARARLVEEQHINAERASRQDAAKERLLGLQVSTCLPGLYDGELYTSPCVVILPMNSAHTSPLKADAFGGALQS